MKMICEKCNKEYNADYRFCPSCGEKLIHSGKHTYTVGLSAEESCSGEIELTYEEYKAVEKVCDYLSSISTGWCENFWISE